MKHTAREVLSPKNFGGSSAGELQAPQIGDELCGSIMIDSQNLFTIEFFPFEFCISSMAWQ